jgi:hypothetical protein
MRLLKEIPEMEEKLEHGEMTLSTLARAQTFFRQEKAQLKTREQKIEILKVLEKKSARDVERELLGRSSEPERLLAERLRPISQTHTELRVLLDAEMLRELEELKGLLSHARPHATLRELLEFALRETVTRLRPRAPRGRSKTKSKAQAAEAGAAEHMPRVRAPKEKRGRARDSVPMNRRGACSRAHPSSDAGNAAPASDEIHAIHTPRN